VSERFDPRPLLRNLHDHAVDYVLIGGLAAALHGSPVATNDADICPDRTPENLARLAAALREIDARVRTDAEPAGLPFAIDAVFLGRIETALNLSTRYGNFDISYRPAAFAGGYHELLPHAVDYDIDGFTVKVASLSDIIRSKRTAGRDKDRAVLPVLEALEDEIADQATRDDG